MAKLRKGQKVSWRWGRSRASGTIRQRFTSTVTRTIKGKRIKRKATKDEPAYLVEQPEGDKALKSESELHEA